MQLISWKLILSGLTMLFLADKYTEKNTENSSRFWKGKNEQLINNLAKCELLGLELKKMNPESSSKYSLRWFHIYVVCNNCKISEFSHWLVITNCMKMGMKRGVYENTEQWAQFLTHIKKWVKLV